MAREAGGLFLEPGFVSSLVLLNHKHGITQTGKGVCVCACEEVYTNILMCVYTQTCAGISLIIIGKVRDSYRASIFKSCFSVWDNLISCVLSNKAILPLLSLMWPIEDKKEKTAAVVECPKSLLCGVRAHEFTGEQTGSGLTSIRAALM